MKKTLTAILFWGLTLFVVAQNWEVIPDSPQTHHGIYSMAHYDGEIYCVIDTVLDPLDRRYALVKYDGINWTEYDDFGFIQTPIIRNMKVYNIGDTMLMIVLNYFHTDGSTYERSILLNESGIEILTDFRTYTSLFNTRDGLKALINSHGFVYFDKLNQDPNNDSLIIVFNDGQEKDTINKFLTPQVRPLRSASENGFDIFSEIDFGTHIIPCVCYYDLSSETYTNLNFSGVSHRESSSYPNGSIYTTFDQFFDPSTNPNRRILRYINAQSYMIGDPNMVETYSILDTPMGLLVESKMVNDNVFRIYKYDGSTYSLLSNDLLLISSGGSALTDFYFFQDQLYAFGRIDQINYDQPAYDLVRMPYTHAFNLSPVAIDDAFTLPTDTTVQRLRMRVNDTDIDGDHLFGHVISTQHGTVQEHLSGDFVYTPELGFQGVDTIEYEACDQGGLCDNAFIYVTIQHVVSMTPDAVTDQYVMMENESISFDVSANDDYQNESILIEIIDSTVNGTIDSTLNGLMYYSPNQTFAGFDSLRYVASKTYGSSDTAWVYLEVTLINSAPITNRETAFLLQELTTVDLAPTFVDIDQDSLTKELIAGPFHPDATVQLTTSDTLIYENQNWSTVGLDSVLFKVGDPYGESDSSWIVLHNNRAPVVERDTFYITSSGHVFFPVVNDYDLDSNLSHVEIVQQPTAPNSYAQTCGPYCIQYFNADLSNVEKDSIEYALIDDLGAQSSTWVILINESLSLDETSLESIVVYPVPSKGKVSFKSPAGTISNLKITDISGKSVLEKQDFNLDNSIDISYMSKGTYLIFLNQMPKPLVFVLE